jgi:hypothetical protein
MIRVAATEKPHQRQKSFYPYIAACASMLPDRIAMPSNPSGTHSDKSATI